MKKTDVWIKANNQAEVAQKKINSLLDDSNKKEMDLDNQDDFEELEKAIDVPKKMISEAIDADKSIQNLRTKLSDLQAKHAELRKRIPDSAIASQPAVQAAMAKLEEAKNKASEAQELLAKKRRKCCPATNPSCRLGQNYLKQSWPIRKTITAIRSLKGRRTTNRTPKGLA